jgi:8-oxo-dGTP pyrophosphatase MutT (NUDIX family)
MQVQGAAAVIFDDGGRVLLVKENYDRRRYAFPGGAVEAHEAPEDAVVREVKEETGLDVAVDHLIGLYRLDDGVSVHLFRCRIVRGTPALPDTGEIAEVGWYTPDAVPAPVTNVLHHALPDAVAGRRGVVRSGLARLN